MATWQEFSDEAPQLAIPVEACFRAHTHHVLATVRRDRSPRVSGTEVRWHGGDLVLGSMHGAMKALDLRRDGRFAVHANPGEGMSGGDAKVAGRAVEVVDPDELRAFTSEEQPPGDFHLFRLALSEVVLTEVAEDEQHLRIRLWRPGHGVDTIKRY
jgi:hypothetical protein